MAAMIAATLSAKAQPTQVQSVSQTCGRQNRSHLVRFEIPNVNYFLLDGIQMEYIERLILTILYSPFGTGHHSW